MPKDKLHYKCLLQCLIWQWTSFGYISHDRNQKPLLYLIGQAFEYFDGLWIRHLNCETSQNLIYSQKDKWAETKWRTYCRSSAFLLRSSAIFKSWPTTSLIWGSSASWGLPPRSSWLTCMDGSSKVTRSIIYLHVKNQSAVPVREMHSLKQIHEHIIYKTYIWPIWNWRLHEFTFLAE